jgi:digeranylgeranylglycerophospholipid reductase
MAIRNGARYKVKTRATDVIMEDGYVKGVKAEYMGEKLELKAKLVIAADGVDSKIARSVGIDTKNYLKDYHSGFQYEMAGLNLEESSMLHLFFGSNYAPKGYLWIFPKGKDVANVGIGILSSLSEDGKRAQDYLDRFIESRPEIFKNASPIEINAGGIPVGAPIDSFVENGFMVVGDAAHQVNPIHGGGLSLAMDAGKIAAEVASEALARGDVSKKSLQEYDKRFKDRFQKKLSKLYKLRMFLEKLNDDDYEFMAEHLSGKDVVEAISSKYSFIIKLFAKNKRNVASLAKRFLT